MTESQKKTAVLVVDDNPDTLEIFTKALEHSGFSVVSTRWGVEAHDLAVHHSPSIILLDLNLPDLNGYAVAERLQADEATRSIPVVAVTAHSHPKARDLAIAAGCVEFITKPVLPNDLTAEVKRLLSVETAP